MKSFHERLIEANRRSFELREKEIQRAAAIIKAAEPLIEEIERAMYGELRLDAPLTYGGITNYSLHISFAHYQQSDTRLHDTMLRLGYVEVARLAIQSGLWDYVSLRKNGVTFSLSTTIGHAAEFKKPIHMHRRHSDRVGVPA
ncbi:hypothetical protein ACO0K2_04235 [Undibacterium sp. MH2W]|uniref:hypothetical protein n=1 Tax=Undibacterium sp. MH2W TaxID=3413044 RepID=UPI003BF2F6DE